MVRTHRIVVYAGGLALLLVAVLALAACGGDSTSAAPSTSATASSTPTSPALTSEAELEVMAGRAYLAAAAKLNRRIAPLRARIRAASEADDARRFSSSLGAYGTLLRDSVGDIVAIEYPPAAQESADDLVRAEYRLASAARALADDVKRRGRFASEELAADLRAAAADHEAVVALLRARLDLPPAPGG